MNMLEALAQVKNDEIIARPVSWRGSGRGITWMQSDDKSPVVWVLGWREIGQYVPCHFTEADYRSAAKVALPSPSELQEEWEVIDRNVILKEIGEGTGWIEKILSG